MSDPSKPSSIPAWQRQSASSSTDQSSSQSTSSPSSDDAPAPTSREDLLSQATRFLEDESIRNSPPDRKIAFLESKGLNSDEIQQVLGISRNLEATSTIPSATEEKAEESPETSASSPSKAQATPSSSTSTTAQSQSSSQSPSTTMSQPRSSTATTDPSPIAKRDEPPIITYPEFLFQPSKPPPLVSMQSILYTLYGAAGLGASIYGASEYLIKPMLENLASARHEFAETAQDNLQKLNEQLEKTVSVIPAHLTARKDKSSEEDTEEDTDSVTSDPTELFHRDVGTQTTPDVSSSSTSLESTKDENAPDAPLSAVSNHMARLKAIQTELNEVNDVEGVSSSWDETMRSSISELHHYLDGLMYSTPSYTVGGSGLYANSTSGSGKATGVRKGEDDAITSFKADIRGVKGALLSARNFPASRGGRRGGFTAGAR
ncbi:hypothetical protein N7478_000094 [Penicillium angulare]|uniref:uncharacterized protein n=1 Tax=Penicillium angulare TaxID=116970 RepID=UPI002541E67F|nr:uncharacterized protein N7478_000094 [Penicillium angulare]KAJ5290843.1 hypothetical protein N7478_000094 [Penicillium angulare]